MSKQQEQVPYFHSLPQTSKVPEEEQCGVEYIEIDSREGAFKAICRKKRGHSGRHGPY